MDKEEQYARFTHPVFRRKNNLEFDYAQTTGIYSNRAFGSNRYYRTADVDFNAGFAAGKETGPDGCLFVASQAVGRLLPDVR
jgi:hypothetical protein